MKVSKETKKNIAIAGALFVVGAFGGYAVIGKIVTGYFWWQW